MFIFTSQGRLIYAVMIMCLIPLCIFGNSVVLFVYLYRMEKTTSSALIIYLASIELLIGSVAMPMELIDHSLFPDDETAVWYCRISISAITWGLMCESLTLLFIAFDRWLRASNPMKRHKYITKRSVKITESLFITMSFILSFLYGFSHVSKKDDDLAGIYSCAEDINNDVKNALYMVIQSLLGVVILSIAFFYFQFGRISHLVMLNVKQQIKQSSSKHTGSHDKKHNYLQTPSKEAEKVSFVELVYDIDHNLITWSPLPDKIVNNSCLYNNNCLVNLMTDFYQTDSQTVNVSSLFDMTWEKHLPKNMQNIKIVTAKNSNNCHVTHSEKIKPSDALVTQTSSSGKQRGTATSNTGSTGQTGPRQSTQQSGTPTNTQGTSGDSYLEQGVRMLKLYFNRLTVTCIAVTLIFALSWTPFFVLEVFLKRLSPDDYKSVITNDDEGIIFCFSNFYFINSIANPIVYSILNERFRFECKRFFCSKKRYVSSNHNLQRKELEVMLEKRLKQSERLELILFKDYKNEIPVANNKQIYNSLHKAHPKHMSQTPPGSVDPSKNKSKSQKQASQNTNRK